MINKVGVVTPVWNTKKNNRTYLFEDTAGSVLSQDYDFLWFIVDNGSTDERTLDFYETLSDPRVRIEKIGRRMEKTPSRALNFGFNLLYEEGYDAFCYLHSDDILMQCSLEDRVNLLNEGNNMAYGRMALILDGNLYLNSYPVSDFTSSRILGSGFPHHSSMWDGDMVEKMLSKREGVLFDTSMSANEDIDVTLFSRRLIDNHGYSLGFLDKALYVWVNHLGNITNSIWGIESMRQSRYAYRKNGFEIPDSLSWKSYFSRPGFWLPNKLKRKLVPLKNFVKKVSHGKMYSSSYTELKLDISPYWFKKEISLTTP